MDIVVSMQDIEEPRGPGRVWYHPTLSCFRATEHTTSHLVVLIDVASPSSSRAPFFTTETKVWRKWPVDVTHTRAEHACTRSLRWKPPQRDGAVAATLCTRYRSLTTRRLQHCFEKYSPAGDTRRPLSTRSLAQHTFRKISACWCKK